MSRMTERIIRLPCSFGDTVYVVDTDDSIITVDERKVSGFRIGDDYELYIYTGVQGSPFKASDIGVTVFFSKEEAEKVLEG